MLPNPRRNPGNLLAAVASILAALLAVLLVTQAAHADDGEQEQAGETVSCLTR